MAKRDPITHRRRNALKRGRRRSGDRYPHPLVGTDVPKCNLHVLCFSGVKTVISHV